MREEISKTLLVLPVALATVLFAVAPPATANEIFDENVVCQQSLCVGWGCEDHPAFGYDTILLKEDTLRIKFEDTSTTSAYPSNDWQITINERENGGADKFSIDDITSGETPFTIEGGAPGHALFIDQAGRIGFGTSTPATELHVITGNTPTLRLEQDGSMGWDPQSWDVGANEDHFYVRDATHDAKLVFRIEPDAPADALFVGSDGRVGLGTDAPAASLHLRQEGRPTSIVFENEANGVKWLAGIGAIEGGLTTADALDDFVITKATSLRPGPGTRPRVRGEAVFGITGEGHVYLKGVPIHPDYVFEPGYELMPLDELERFIQTEKRLPNVPSAETVESEGLNLNLFITHLLEKIEELTLHAIEQDKRIARLEGGL
ncbi:MAG: hypothetical protein GY769_16120 [bacterium]|nr:hypothetical protein [bacterium]